MSITKLNLSWLLTLTLVCGVEAQQSSPTPAPPVFAVQTSLIHVDALVTDTKGRQVTNLSAADFEIESNGRKYPVTVATYVPLVEGIAPATIGGKLQAQDIRRVMAFLIARPVISLMGDDNMSARLPGTESLDRMMKQYVLNEMKPRDLVALVNVDNPKSLLTQFTSSTGVFATSVSTLRKDWTNPDVSPVFVAPGNLEPLARYCEDVIKTARSVVGRLGQMPGRKILFMVSGILQFTGEWYSDVGRQAKQLVEEANRRGVTIYGINVNGTESGFSDALGMLAEETGGSTIENTNLMADNLAKVMELNRGYYLLGYDPGEAADALPRRVKVRSKREGLKVIARPQAYADSSLTADASSANSEQALAALLDSPVAAGQIGVGIEPYVRWTGPLAGEFQAVVDIDPASLGEMATGTTADLDVITRIVDQRGAVVKASRMSLKPRAKSEGRSRIRFMVAAPLSAPGFYQADVAVRDKNGGRSGNATARAALADLRENKTSLLASTLSLRALGQTGVVPGNAFAEGSSVVLAVVVAHARRVEGTREARLQVKVRITQNRETASELDPFTISKVLPELIDVKGEVGLDGLPEGAYVMNLIITDLLGDAGKNEVVLSSPFSIIGTDSPLGLE